MAEFIAEATIIPGRMGRVVRRIDRISEWSGRAVAWLTVPLILTLMFEVVSRYVFDKPTVWAYDFTYMIYGAHFMLVAAFTLRHQGHIRTDFLYRTWSVRTQGRVDAALYILFFLPALTLFFIASWDFAFESVTKLERGFDSPWMPPIYPLKSAMPISAALLILQGVSEFFKSLFAAQHGRWP